MINKLKNKSYIKNLNYKKRRLKDENTKISIWLKWLFFLAILILFTSYIVLLINLWIGKYS